MFKLAKGQARVEWYPKVASTAFTNGALVYATGSGTITPAITTSGDHIGVIQKDVASTDSDYASNTLVPVLVPHEGAEFEADTASAVSTNVGNSYDLSDSLTVNVGATSKKVFLVTKVLSATKVLGKVNAMAVYKDVVTT